ncbi:MAG: hypothetical protein HYZ79_02630, partial [Candidatus Melainabacteria bacterium]|nr:hypothetical protein [Candidatus Melainabacteria bacterium]
EQLLKVNDILPEPIEYLFLQPKDWLFKNNQEQILANKPILDDSYSLIGFDQEKHIVVYKLDK